MALDVSKVICNAHEQPVLCVAYNRQRREVFSGAQDGLIKVWDSETGKLIRTQAGHKGWVTDVLYSITTHYLFSGSVDGTLVAWSEKGKEMQVIEYGGPVFCLSWNQKRKHLIAAGNGVVHMYKVQAQAYASPAFGTSEQQMSDQDKVLKLIASVRSHTDIIRGLCCSDSGKIFSAGYDKAVCMYDSERPKEFARFENCHEGAICSLALDMDNNWLITGSYDGVVKIWSQEGRCLDAFEGLCDTVTGLCYVPAVKNYWITGKNRKLVAYDPRTPTNITPYVKETCRFDEFQVSSLHQSPGSDVVLGITTARQLIVWRYNAAAAFRVLNGHRDWVETLVVVQREMDDSVPQVYSAGSDGLVLRWQANSELNTDLFTCQEELSGHEGAILCMIFSKELDMLVTGSEDTTIRLWPLGTSVDVEAGSMDGEVPNVLLGHEMRVSALAELGEHVLASVSHDLSLRFWDLHTRHEMASIFRAHDSPIHTLEYNSTSEEVATAAQEPTVKVWNAFRPFALKFLLSGHKGDVTALRWCEWKASWVTAADDHTIRFWSSGGEPVRVMGFRGESVTAMYLDQFNHLLLAAMTDRAIRVYELGFEEQEHFCSRTSDSSFVLTANTPEQATPIMIYNGHTDLVRAMVYVEEKGQYLSGGWDKTIRVWFSPKKNEEGQCNSTQSAQETTPIDLPDEEDGFISTYERENPLVQPRALRNQAGFTLKLSKLPVQKKEIDTTLQGAGQSEDTGAKECRTSLGRRLNELETKLSMRMGIVEQAPAKGATTKNVGLRGNGAAARSRAR